MHLGDEFGMVGWPSLSDFPSALSAYRTGAKIYERAAQIEPANPSVLRGIVEIHRRVGAIQLHTDPGGAVSELRNAMKGMDALHEQAKHSMEFRRLEAGVLGPYAGALTEIGQYRQALAALEQGRAIQEALLAADPKDLRSIQDLYAGLTREAECYQERAAGIFAEEGSNRTADAANALRVLLKERSLLEDIVRIEPNDSAWPAKLGLVLIDIARQQRALQRPEGSLALAQKGLSILKDVGRRPYTKAFQLDDVATGLITVEPATLREPALAVNYAERTVEMSAHRNAEFLLTLAHAYRAAGQASKARAAAQEGLALLPSETEATVPCRVRKLLQAEIRRSTSK
jgi:tetratricopeptide (TPR) repeat protein